MGLFKNRQSESLFDAEKVDVVSLAPSGEGVDLVIVADNPWTGRCSWGTPAEPRVRDAQQQAMAPQGRTARSSSGPPGVEL